MIITTKPSTENTMNELTKYSDALDYATIKHKGQFRKAGNVPYITHPINVAKLLQANNCKDEVIIAGLLHDVVEDTPTPIEEITAKFGKKVSDLVASVTEKGDGISWDERLSRYMKKVESSGPDTKMICAADKIDNMNSTTDCLKNGINIFEKLHAGKDKQLNKFKLIIDKIGADLTPKMKQAYIDALNNLINACKK